MNDSKSTHGAEENDSNNTVYLNASEKAFPAEVVADLLQALGMTVVRESSTRIEKKAATKKCQDKENCPIAVPQGQAEAPRWDSELVDGMFADLPVKPSIYEPTDEEVEAYGWWAQRKLRKKYRRARQLMLLAQLRNHPLLNSCLLLQSLRNKSQ